MICQSNFRKNTDALTLVNELKKDNLFRKFDGFGITPRDESTNIYIFFRDEPPKIVCWLKYDSNDPDLFNRDNEQLKKNLAIIKEMDSVNYKKFNTQYLNKAFKLISIMKQLKIKSVNASFGKFYCSFNDSSKLRYVKNANTVDSNFIRTYKYFKWIDSNFISYY